MSAKREARRQRSALERENKERRRRQQVMRSRLLFALGAAAVVALGFLLTQRERPGGRPGQVWSAAHGHWHDR
ncbi:MAG: hypothetical protein ACRENH_03475 [Gemmatimonadaceae bacterium]